MLGKLDSDTQRGPRLLSLKHTKINSKWIKDLKVKLEMMKL